MQEYLYCSFVLKQGDRYVNNRPLPQVSAVGRNVLLVLTDTFLLDPKVKKTRNELEIYCYVHVSCTKIFHPLGKYILLFMIECPSYVWNLESMCIFLKAIWSVNLWCQHYPTQLQALPLWSRNQSFMSPLTFFFSNHDLFNAPVRDFLNQNIADTNAIITDTN